MKVMRLYDEKLKAHPHYKKFIAHTPFDNDCAAIAWDVVHELQIENGTYKIPDNTMIKTITELKALNQANGWHWFDKPAVAFFARRVESGILPGNMFISSEALGENGTRVYTPRQFNEQGRILRVGKPDRYLTLAGALVAARELHEAGKAVAA